MKKGFFNLEDDDGYDFLQALNIGDSVVDAHCFLHGICHQFALALNTLFGYDIVLWMDYDKDIEAGVLVHAFNIFEHDGKQYYADIRGITDNVADIVGEFDFIRELDDVFGYNRDDAESVLNGIGVDLDISDSAFKIIQTYESHYLVNG